MVKKVLLLLLLLASIDGVSQSYDTIFKEVPKLPMANNRATIKGYPYDTAFIAKYDSLTHDFKITLADPSYKIVFFTLYYDCEECDIWFKVIHGDIVKWDETPLKKRKPAILSFQYFKIQKGNKYYTIPDFIVVVDL
jgi:hypothetical protein